MNLLITQLSVFLTILKLLNSATGQIYFGFDPRVPPTAPQLPLFPLQNSYVPNHYGVAPPDYVFASYTQGGFKFQGPAPDAEDSDDSGDSDDSAAADRGPPAPATTFSETPAGPGFGYSSDADDDDSSGGGDNGDAEATLKRYRQKAYQHMRNVMAQRRVKY